MVGRQTASASLGTLRVTIVRTGEVEGALGRQAVSEVTINPEAVTGLRAASDPPPAVRVILVVDGVATVIYDDVTPRDA